jgi:hypothetical protein
MKGLPSWFVPLWCISMPVTSLLIVPSVQGTIPAYMLAFISAFFLLVSRGGPASQAQRTRYLSIALLVAGLWLLLLCGSQIGDIISNRRNFGDLALINPDDTKVVLRSALFTQTLYLSACLCLALFFRFCFRPEWMRYVLWGGWFLAIYGIYEWLFFLVFQQPGDFIANRTYGAEEHTGSWSQAMQVGPLLLLRMKSTFGEPSWFSAGVIPYLFLALENKRKWLSTALLFCVVLSMSTSAYVGFPIALALQSFFRRKISASIVVVVVLFVTAFVTLYFVYPETYNQMFTAKMAGENDSGQVRQDAGQAMRETMATFSLMNRFFGIGFGYYYGGVFYSVLVNTGLIGLLIYTYAFLKPMFCLRAEEGNIALKVTLGTLFFLFWVSVSELFLPTTWMFLGLAYWRLDQQKQRSKSSSSEELGLPAEPRLAHAGEA